MDTSVSEYDPNKDFSILKSEEVLGKEPSPLVQLKKKDRKDKRDKLTTSTTTSSTTSTTTSTTDSINSSEFTGITDEVTDIKGDETKTTTKSAESTDKPFIDDKPKITSPLISEPFRPSSSIPSPPPISKSSKIPPSDKSDESTVHSFASDRPGDQTSSISSDQCAIRVNESSVSSIDDQKISGGGDDDDNETTEFDLEKARKAIEKLQVEDSDQSKEKNDRSLLTDSPPPISRSQLDSLDPKSDDSSDFKSPDIKSDLKSDRKSDDIKSDDVKSDVKSDIKSSDKKSSDKSFDIKSDVKSEKKSKDIQSEAKKDDERKIDIDDNINRNVNRNVKSDDNNDKFNKDDNNNRNVNDDEEMKDLTNVKSDDKSVKSNIDSNLSQKNVDSTAFTGVDDKKGACDVATSQTRPPIDPLLYSDLSSLASPQS